MTQQSDKTFSRIMWHRSVELAARWFVCLGINVYGWAKIIGTQFPEWTELSENFMNAQVRYLSGIEIVWLFMGYSYPYNFFVGISQICGGILLLFDKTKYLGILIVFPILLNIVLIDIFYEIPIGALNNAIFYLLLLIVIMFLNFNRIKSFWQSLTKEHFGFFTFDRKIMGLLALTLIVFFILFLLKWILLQLLNI